MCKSLFATFDPCVPLDVQSVVLIPHVLWIHELWLYMCLVLWADYHPSFPSETLEHVTQLQRCDLLMCFQLFLVYGVWYIHNTCKYDQFIIGLASHVSFVIDNKKNITMKYMTASLLLRRFYVYVLCFSTETTWELSVEAFIKRCWSNFVIVQHRKSPWATRRRGGVLVDKDRVSDGSQRNMGGIHKEEWRGSDRVTWMDVVPSSISIGLIVMKVGPVKTLI